MKNPWKLSTLILALALVLSLAIPALRAGEPQPRIRAALRHLKQAANNLEKGSHDKGGHRVKALALTREAIVQAQKAIHFDNKH